MPKRKHFVLEYKFFCAQAQFLIARAPTKSCPSMKVLARAERQTFDPFSTLYFHTYVGPDLSSSMFATLQKY